MAFTYSSNTWDIAQLVRPMYGCKQFHKTVMRRPMYAHNRVLRNPTCVHIVPTVYYEGPCILKMLEGCETEQYLAVIVLDVFLYDFFS